MIGPPQKNFLNYKIAKVAPKKIRCHKKFLSTLTKIHRGKGVPWIKMSDLDDFVAKRYKLNPFLG